MRIYNLTTKLKKKLLMQIFNEYLVFPALIDINMSMAVSYYLQLNSIF